MKVIESIKEMQDISKRHGLEGKTIGFVPTMGYLHEGHLTLARESKKSCDITVVSIFVNPLQFGPKEDLAVYPRDFERDKMLLVREEVDYVFYPSGKEMYPEGFQTFVEVDNLSRNLCGASRLGHFKGVATVVAKLFNAVMPEKAFFGKKDFQQLALIKRMAKDLNMDIAIVGVPIVREPDGLAMSSRNAYLSSDERQAALCLFRAITEAKSIVSGGILDAKSIIEKVKRIISESPLIRLDYAVLCDPESLEYIDEGDINGEVLLALAVFAGKTRLIDNTILEA